MPPKVNLKRNLYAPVGNAVYNDADFYSGSEDDDEELDADFHDEKPTPDLPFDKLVDPAELEELRLGNVATQIGGIKPKSPVSKDAPKPKKRAANTPLSRIFNPQKRIRREGQNRYPFGAKGRDIGPGDEPQAEPLSHQDHADNIEGWRRSVVPLLQSDPGLMKLMHQDPLNPGMPSEQAFNEALYDTSVDGIPIKQARVHATLFNGKLDMTIVGDGRSVVGRDLLVTALLTSIVYGDLSLIHLFGAEALAGVRPHTQGAILVPTTRIPGHELAIRAMLAFMNHYRSGKPTNIRDALLAHPQVTNFIEAIWAHLGARDHHGNLLMMERLEKELEGLPATAGAEKWYRRPDGNGDVVVVSWGRLARGVLISNGYEKAHAAHKALGQPLRLGDYLPSKYLNLAGFYPLDMLHPTQAAGLPPMIHLRAIPRITGARMLNIADGSSVLLALHTGPVRGLTLGGGITVGVLGPSLAELSAIPEWDGSVFGELAIRWMQGLLEARRPLIRIHMPDGQDLQLKAGIHRLVYGVGPSAMGRFMEWVGRAFLLYYPGGSRIPGPTNACLAWAAIMRRFPGMFHPQKAFLDQVVSALELYMGSPDLMRMSPSLGRGRLKPYQQAQNQVHGLVTSIRLLEFLAQGGGEEGADPLALQLGAALATWIQAGSGRGNDDPPTSAATIRQIMYSTHRVRNSQPAKIPSAPGEAFTPSMVDYTDPQYPSTGMFPSYAELVQAPLTRPDGDHGRDLDFGFDLGPGPAKPVVGEVTLAEDRAPPIGFELDALKLGLRPAFAEEAYDLRVDLPSRYPQFPTHPEYRLRARLPFDKHLGTFDVRELAGGDLSLKRVPPASDAVATTPPQLPNIEAAMGRMTIQALDDEGGFFQTVPSADTIPPHLLAERESAIDRQPPGILAMRRAIVGAMKHVKQLPSQRQFADALGEDGPNRALLFRVISRVATNPSKGQLHQMRILDLWGLGLNDGEVESLVPILTRLAVLFYPLVYFDEARDRFWVDLPTMWWLLTPVVRKMPEEKGVGGGGGLPHMTFRDLETDWVRWQLSQRFGAMGYDPARPADLFLAVHEILAGSPRLFFVVGDYALIGNLLEAPELGHWPRIHLVPSTNLDGDMELELPAMILIGNSYLQELYAQRHVQNSRWNWLIAPLLAGPNNLTFMSLGAAENMPELPTLAATLSLSKKGLLGIPRSPTMEWTWAVPQANYWYTLLTPEIISQRHPWLAPLFLARWGAVQARLHVSVMKMEPGMIPPTAQLVYSHENDLGDKAMIVRGGLKSVVITPNLYWTELDYLFRMAVLNADVAFDNVADDDSGPIPLLIYVF